MITNIFDSNENLRNAGEADAPQHGCCILCRAKMYRRVSDLGNPHYALIPGERHAYDECRALDSSTQRFALANTSPEDILNHYFGEGILPNGPPGTGSPGGKTHGPAGEKTCKVVSLAQLCALGYLDSVNQPMGSNQWLSSISISPKYAYMLLGLQQVGKRILQGKPLTANDKSQTVRMRIYIHRNIDGKVVNRFKIADIHIADAKTYEKVKKMLFEEYRDEATQEVKQRRRYNRIAVIADWVSVPPGECACGWTCEYEGWKCTGRLYAEITRAKCVYAIPHSKVVDSKDGSYPAQ